MPISQSKFVHKTISLTLSQCVVVVLGSTLYMWVDKVLQHHSHAFEKSFSLNVISNTGDSYGQHQ